MTLLGPPSALAPLASGHPSSLPQIDTMRGSDMRVLAVAKSRDSAGTGTRELPQERTAPKRNGRDTNEPPPEPASGTKKTAPPTILQLKIDEMLREQAEALADAQVPEPKDERPDMSARTEADGATRAPETPREAAEAGMSAQSSRASEIGTEPRPAQPATPPVAQMADDRGPETAEDASTLPEPSAPEPPMV